MSEDETDRDIEAGARFALKVRGAVREPERWALIMQSARSLMGVVSKTPIPPEMDEVTLLALAYVASIRCAKNLPPGEDVDGAVAGLQLIAGV
jgi:hypothetical protein